MLLLRSRIEMITMRLTFERLVRKSYERWRYSFALLNGLTCIHAFVNDMRPFDYIQ